MEQRLEAIRSHVQKLAVILKYGELMILDRDRVTLRTTEEEVSEYVIIPEKRTLSGRIQKNMSIYLQDLNRGDSRDPFMSFEIPGEDWDRKLDHSCRKLLELNIQKKSNAQILEAYYQKGTILAEKEWNDATKKKLNSYFRMEKRKSVWKISKRVYQLFNAR
ncbi:hypothetical protein C2G38_2318114 [Gigaspora rosea]|uniref:Uncharacterized protein n=1 Tax=Gigaspora rosea TaxID=44941 RepID=A0A397V4Q5_9GLOM|nr:hypothetical protein C2G38_2318114 [Gigaspora rosea]